MPCSTVFTRMRTAGSDSGRTFSPDERLTTGPAFREVAGGQAAPLDWPQYRGSAERGGLAGSPISAALRLLWSTPLGRQLTPPVIAGGRLFVAEMTDHRVHALDARTGQLRLWSFSAGGVVDGPPAVWGDCVLFGCADGRVYCLRGKDGEQVWRFQAAPRDCRNMQMEEITSVWPVHGSVLVKDGRVYFASGHSSRLDGGVLVYVLRRVTGDTLSARRVHDVSPARALPTNEKPNDREGVPTDVFVSVGDQVFMQHMAFTDKSLVPSIHALFSYWGVNPDRGITKEKHVYTTAGFLDDSWNHRSIWTYGGVHAQLLVVDRQTVFGIKAYDMAGFHGRYQPASGYILFAQNLDKPGGKVIGGDELSRKELHPHPLDTYAWWLQAAIRVQAMVRSGDCLISAGQPDEVVPGDPFAAFEGRAGGKLLIVASATGKKKTEMTLRSPPVWDGLAVAQHRLFMSAADGNVDCWGEE